MVSVSQFRANLKHYVVTVSLQTYNKRKNRGLDVLD